MSSAADIAAWIGAAAWAPQIGTWAYSRLVKPRVRIIPDSRVSIGYTNFGAIFNVRVAISADRLDAILDRMTVELRHEAGDRHEFSWISLREKFSDITDNQGNRQTVERDQPAIALKVSTALLSEKFILFQEPAYHLARQPIVDKLVEAHNHLKNTVTTYREDTLKSKEFFDLTEFFQTRFWWQAGRYTAHFGIQSANGAKLEAAQFSFTLLKADIDSLRGNIDRLRVDWTNMTMKGAPGYQEEELSWVWREPLFTRVPPA